MDVYGISQDHLALQGRYIMTDNDIGDYAIGKGEEDLEIRLSTVFPSRQGSVGGPIRADELRMIQLFSSEQGVISGRSVRNTEESVAPFSILSITHTGKERSVTVYSQAKGRTTGKILADLKQK